MYTGPERPDAYAVVKRAIALPRPEPHVYHEREYELVRAAVDRMLEGGVPIYPVGAVESGGEFSSGTATVDGRVRALLGELTGGLRATYGSRLRGVYLFGSYARGEADAESDVDVLVVLDRVEEYGPEVDRTGALTSALALEYGLSISRVFVSEQEWKRCDSAFLANVKEEAIPVAEECLKLLEKASRAVKAAETLMREGRK